MQKVSLRSQARHCPFVSNRSVEAVGERIKSAFMVSGHRLWYVRRTNTKRFKSSQVPSNVCEELARSHKMYFHNRVFLLCARELGPCTSAQIADTSMATAALFDQRLRRLSTAQHTICSREPFRSPLDRRISAIVAFMPRPPTPKTTTTDPVRHPKKHSGK